MKWNMRAILRPEVDAAVPELTRSVDIQVNERVLLRPYPRSLCTTAPDIAPQLSRLAPGKAVGRLFDLRAMAVMFK
jgi:hypothetical protein